MNNKGDVNQDISGNHNTQINSGNDTIAAIGSGTYAAGRDIIINSNDDETIKVLKRQIELLEEALANSKQETDKERQRAISIEAILLSKKLLENKKIEFSGWKLMDLAYASAIGGELDFAKILSMRALNIFKENGTVKGIIPALIGLRDVTRLLGEVDESRHYHSELMLHLHEVNQGGI